MHAPSLTTHLSSLFLLFFRSAEGFFSVPYCCLKRSHKIERDTAGTIILLEYCNYGDEQPIIPFL